MYCTTMNKPVYRLNITLKNGEVAMHITMENFVKYIADIILIYFVFRGDNNGLFSQSSGIDTNTKDPYI